MEEPERIKMLRLLKTQIQARQQVYNHITTLEKYFLGSEQGKGCSCKLKPVWTRLVKFWNNTGEKELIDYETKIKE